MGWPQAGPGHKIPTFDFFSGGGGGGGVFLEIRGGDVPSDFPNSYPGLSFRPMPIGQM